MQVHRPPDLSAVAQPIQSSGALLGNPGKALERHHTERHPHDAGMGQVHPPVVLSRTLDGKANFVVRDAMVSGMFLEIA